MIYSQVNTDTFSVKVVEKKSYLSEAKYSNFIRNNEDVLIILDKKLIDDNYEVSFCLYRKGIAVIESTTRIIKNTNIALNILSSWKLAKEAPRFIYGEISDC